MADLVVKQGWSIVTRNYRTRAGEVDIVARDGDVLVFVEVRARTGSAFGLADDSVTAPKLRRIFSAASSFIQEHPHFGESYWRVDLFALALDSAGNVLHCNVYENMTLD